MTSSTGATDKKASRPAPDPAERLAIDSAKRKIAARPPRVTVRFSHLDSGKVDLEGADHNDHAGWLCRLGAVFGTNGRHFALSSLNQLMTAARDNDSKIDATRVNSMLAIVEGAAPESELQAALAIQIAITHFASVTLLSRAMHADQIPQFEAAGNMTVKLARTFALQAETLAKLQRRGEQIVKVVHVHPGAQAIVGNVTARAHGADSANRGSARGGGIDENGNQPHEKAITAAATAPVMPPMWSQDAKWEPVPVASSEKQTTMQDARCRQG